MSFKNMNCDQLLSKFKFDKDVRKSPDNLRRGQFRVGWKKGLEGRGINESTLKKKLTWNNLGYRLGREHPDVFDEGKINEAYERFAQHYEDNGRARK